MADVEQGPDLADLEPEEEEADGVAPLADTTDAAEERRATARKRWSRFGWIVIGAAIAALFQVGGTLLHDGIESANSKTTPVVAPTPASTCPAVQGGNPREGYDYVAVALKPVSGGCWGSTLAGLRPGDKFLIGVSYQNMHRKQQDDVTLSLGLPKGFQYVAGSSYIANSTTGGKYKPTIDGITSTGINTGSFQWKGNVFYKFTVVMTQDVGRLCDVNAWAFAASATTDYSPAPVWGSAGAITVNDACS
jgi:hypothetical protein